MIRYLGTVLLHQLRQRLILYLLTLSGVALGVASVVAIQIINLNAIGAFEATLTATTGEADLSLVGRSDYISEELYPEVLATEGVAAAWPIFEVDVYVEEGGFFLKIFGIDLTRPLQLPWEGAPLQLGAALTTPGWVAITPELAQDRGWSPGDRITVVSGSKKLSLSVGKLVDFSRYDTRASSKLAVMDIAQAQSYFWGEGRLSRIGVKVVAGLEPARVAQKLAAGTQLEVQTSETARQSARRLLEAFRLNLTALSYISLLVGLFVVYTSSQAALLRRRSEFGLLRCCGATRGQILTLILAEIALLGVVGVAIGLPLGYYAAQKNVGMVNSTLTNIYLLNEIESLHLPPAVFLMAALVGIGAALLGALLPALDMSRKNPSALMAAFSLHKKMTSAALPLFMGGLAVISIAVVWYFLGAGNWKPAGFVLGTAILIALPLIIPQLIRVVGNRVTVRGFGLGYSFKTLADRLQSSSFAIASLAVAMSMLIGVTLLIGSFRSTVEVWVNTTIVADIYASSRSWREGGSSATINPEDIQLLVSFSGVRTADRLRALRVRVGDDTIQLSGVQLGIEQAEMRYPFLAGDPRSAFWALQERDAILISEPLAVKQGFQVGDMLQLWGPTGKQSLEIVGIIYDYTSEVGTAVMDLNAMNRIFGPGGITNLALYLEPGRDPEHTAAEIGQLLSGSSLNLNSNQTVRTGALRLFDQTFAVVRILQLMSLLIAVCGITLTLLILAQERRPELALYQALGALRYQIFGVFVGKGLSMAAAGILLGLGGGTALAAILIYAINRAYFGWTIQFSVPWSALLAEVGSLLAATLLASLYPALRASRTPTTELSRDDV